MSRLLTPHHGCKEFNVMRNFAIDHYRDVPGSKVRLKDFLSGLNQALEDQGLPGMSAMRVTAYLKDTDTPVGLWANGCRYVANIAEEWQVPSLPWIVVDGRLRRSV